MVRVPVDSLPLDSEADGWLELLLGVIKAEGIIAAGRIRKTLTPEWNDIFKLDVGHAFGGVGRVRDVKKRECSEWWGEGGGVRLWNKLKPKESVPVEEGTEEDPVQDQATQEFWKRMRSAAAERKEEGGGDAKVDTSLGGVLGGLKLIRIQGGHKLEEWFDLKSRADTDDGGDKVEEWFDLKSRADKDDVVTGRIRLRIVIRERPSEAQVATRPGFESLGRLKLRTRPANKVYLNLRPPQPAAEAE
ncbi:hypothetical protein T484DRAFT_1762767, partial [Baffinella frigidus]